MGACMRTPITRCPNPHELYNSLDPIEARLSERGMPIAPCFVACRKDEEWRAYTHLWVSHFQAFKTARPLFYVFERVSA